MKRILFVMSDVFSLGGIQRFNQTLVAATARLPIRSTVLSLHDTSTSIAASSAAARFPAVRIRGFQGKRRDFARTLVSILWRERFDFVFVGHINFLVLSALAIWSRPLVRPRLMMIAHGIEVWSGIGPLRRLALRQVFKILCVSRYTRTRMLQQAPALEPPRLIVFPNALSDAWRKPAATSETRTANYLLSVTRLQKGDRYKGLMTVMEALCMLDDRNLHYVIVGEGDDLPFLRAAAVRLNVHDRVHFRTNISDAELVTMYGQCAAFVLPSGKEGFGIVFLEAMFFGAPVIAAAEKGALDVVRDGENGLLVRFGDCIALCQAIERILSDDPLREKLRRHGSALVRDGGEFTFERFVERCATAFEIQGARG